MPDPDPREVILEARELTREFDGVKALDRLSLRLHRGECLGLLGANGAGKTTAMNCMLGLTLPTSGDLRLRQIPPKHRIEILQRANFSSAYVSLPGNLKVWQNLVVFAQSTASATPKTKSPPSSNSSKSPTSPTTSPGASPPASPPASTLQGLPQRPRAAHARRAHRQPRPRHRRQSPQSRPPRPGRARHQHPLHQPQHARHRGGLRPRHLPPQRPHRRRRHPRQIVQNSPKTPSRTSSSKSPAAATSKNDPPPQDHPPIPPRHTSSHQDRIMEGKIIQAEPRPSSCLPATPFP